MNFQSLNHSLYLRFYMCFLGPCPGPLIPSHLQHCQSQKANYATELMTFGGKYELDDHVVIFRPSTVVVESASMVRHRTRGVSLLRMAD